MYEALELAFKLHGHDARKSSQIPYVAHLLHVCALVLQDGGDEDEVISSPLKHRNHLKINSNGWSKNWKAWQA